VTKSSNAPPLGLYLHIPFCVSLCGYCTFARGLLDVGLKRRYVAALEQEIRGARQPAEAPAPADTIYFGGGTPSLLDPLDVARLLAACRDSFDLSSDAEITLEANPESADRAKLPAFREAGVNRLSLGVQSFLDPELRLLGRIHAAARGRAAVEDAREAGFDNVSVDLIMGLPQQTLADWLASVESLISLEPVHAALYVLEIHPDVPLRREMASRGLEPVDEDAAADMYIAAMERLEAAGWRQYEISNLARPGLESRHNLKYWTDGDWIGFGSGAHSTRGGVRWKNVRGIEDYIDRVGAGRWPAAERQVLTARQRLEEALFMGLRLSAGVDADAVSRRYGLDVWTSYGERLAPSVAAGLLVRDGGTLRLTRRGMLLANEVMMSFV
jgi:oxygen-independent coproporphyrinogen-3 oxidase